jgi:DinB superfamily
MRRAARVRETCHECGFNSDDWSDEQAIDEIGRLPQRWAAIVDNLSGSTLSSRHITDRWSICEYTDHVRETTFGMRFLLDVAIDSPGTDHGPAPEGTFAHVARDVNIQVALRGFGSEVALLVGRIGGLTSEEWERTVTIGTEQVDAHWILRHLIHDVTHHIGDIVQIKNAAERAN